MVLQISTGISRLRHTRKPYKRSVAGSLASTAITVGSNSKKSRNRPKNDIIKRNIQLAGTGDYLTPDERLRVEQILATIDEIENEEANTKSTNHQLVKIDSDAARLSRIDNLLEEKYSFSNKLEATNDLRLSYVTFHIIWYILYVTYDMFSLQMVTQYSVW